MNQASGLIAVTAAMICAGISPCNGMAQSRLAESFEVELLARIDADRSQDPLPFFAQSVAVGDGLAVVGSPSFSSNGVIGTGAAFAHDLENGDLRHQLDVPGLLPNVNFGQSVSISGQFIAVGDTGRFSDPSKPERVYIFDAISGNLLHTLSHPTGADEDLGFGQFMDADEGRLVVGSFDDHLSVFDLETGSLLHHHTDVHDRALRPIELEGRYVVARAGFRYPNQSRDESVAAVYDILTGERVSDFLIPVESSITGSNLLDQFGSDFAIDGDHVVVGGKFIDTVGPSSGAAFVFNWRTGEQLHVLQSDNITIGDGLGASVAADDGVILIGAEFDGPGSAYFFDAESGQQLAKLQPEDLAFSAFFGDSVDLDDGYAIIAAPDLGIGRAYTYRYGFVPEPGTAVLISAAVLVARTRRPRR